MHKRRHGRVHAQGVASHLRVGATFSPGVSVENLSQGGAFVRTHEALPPGTPVAVDLIRPGLKTVLRLTGRVASSLAMEEARSRNVVPGMGIQFDPHPPEVRKRLIELLESLAPSGEELQGDLPIRVPRSRGKPRQRPEETREWPPPLLLPVPAPPAGQRSVSVPGSARLGVQVKALLRELSDAQSRAICLESENEKLRAEIERLRAELGRTRRQ